MLTTPRLHLVPADLPILDALIQKRSELTTPVACRIPEDWTEFPEVLEPTYQLLKGKPSLSPWWMYIFVHRADQVLIGSGGFKGLPDEDGTVEIGYEIYAPYRQQGLATEVAKELVSFALSQPKIRNVMAHTLPEQNPSNRLLKKIGFKFDGTIQDPDDGEIWQWILKK